MLSFLSGIIETKSINPNRCVVNVGGIGFMVFVSHFSWTSIETGSQSKLHTALHISQEMVKIYGFTHVWELNFFELLSSVKGIGPRSAMALIDGLSPKQIVQAIAEGSEDTLAKAQGIGKKTAERIIFELKPKLIELENLIPRSASGLGLENEDLGKFAEARNILSSLGYSQTETEKAIQANSHLGASNGNMEEMLKACLTWLSVN
ncbi:MAG: Holliday junction branch migration protein RuvA [Candidatus Melainabacteria bacterium]|jgi:Holliday junction DNA helicase RuvA